MPRTNLRDSIKPDMLATGTRAKIIARNTFKRTAPNGDTVIRLHHTDIVRISPKGKVTLNSGSWRTMTTKARMQRYMPDGYQLISDRGLWYVVRVEHSYVWDKRNPRVAFYDGTTVPDCFNATALRKAQTAERRQLQLRSRIKTFINRLDKLECLPNPSQGDCWLCCMRDKSGVSMGEHGGRASNSDHLSAHVKEGYLHGSLVWNALAAAGYKDPSFIGAYENRDMQQGKKPVRAKRALKRYLHRELGLVV